MKLTQAADELAKLAEANDAMSFIFDSSQEGKVRVDWMGVLKIEVLARELPDAINAMRLLEDLGIVVVWGPTPP